MLKNKSAGNPKLWDSSGAASTQVDVAAGKHKRPSWVMTIDGVHPGIWSRARETMFRWSWQVAGASLPSDQFAALPFLGADGTAAVVALIAAITTRVVVGVN